MKRGLMIVLVAAASAAQAHGDAQHAAPRTAAVVETAFGRSGNPAQAGRVIKVSMRDTMRFSPAALTVRAGETVRFVVANHGALMHEMVIGRAAELAEHAELMKRYPSMEHEEPYMAHVAPGKSGEIVWQFTTPGEFRFACLMPGHFEAGMVGRITVLPESPAR